MREPDRLEEPYMPAPSALPEQGLPGMRHEGGRRLFEAGLEASEEGSMLERSMRTWLAERETMGEVRGERKILRRRLAKYLQ